MAAGTLPEKACSSKTGSAVLGELWRIHFWQGLASEGTDHMAIGLAVLVRIELGELH